MPTYANLCALIENIDHSIELALSSGQSMAAYQLSIASLEVSEQIQKFEPPKQVPT
jgi:hypothetical protein